jgi:hypothetical protein
MTRLVYDFIEEPTADLLRYLLIEASEIATTCGFVVQTDFPTNQRATRLATELHSYLKTSKEVASWPGTQLYGESRAIRYEYAFSQHVAGLLSEAADGLYEWVAPDLPEDLHLLRQDGSVFLGSVAHERDAWLEADHEEFARLAQSVPGLDQIVTVRSGG